MKHNHYPIENQVTHECREIIAKEKKYAEFLKKQQYVVFKPKKKAT